MPSLEEILGMTQERPVSREEQRLRYKLMIEAIAYGFDYAGDGKGDPDGVQVMKVLNIFASLEDAISEDDESAISKPIYEALGDSLQGIADTMHKLVALAEVRAGARGKSTTWETMKDEHRIRVAELRQQEDALANAGGDLN